MGLNKFSALTDDEFQQQYLGLSIPENIEIMTDNTDNLRIGDVNWTTKGAVTPVKDQGECGSCWAFSATGAIEGLSKLAGSQIGNFSEQQLIDCSGKYGNMGCNGGLMDNAFKFIKNNGISSQAEYPYKGIKQTCAKSTGSYKISSFVDVKNCNDLVNAVAGRPVSVAVDATNWSKYQSGVFNNCSTKINHGVLLTGLTD